MISQRKRGRRAPVVLLAAGLMTALAGCGGDEAGDDPWRPLSTLKGDQPHAVADCGDGVLLENRGFGESEPLFVDWEREEVFDLEDTLEQLAEDGVEGAAPEGGGDYAVACVPTDDGPVRLIQVAAAIDWDELDEDGDITEQLAEDRPATWVALDADWRLLWSRRLDDVATAAVGTGTASFRVDDATVVLDARTGDEVASSEETRIRPASPVSYIDDGLRAANGQVLADLSLPQPLVGSPWVLGTDYDIDRDRHDLLLVDAATGSEQWSTPIRVLPREVRYDAATRIIVWVDTDGVLRGTDVMTGDELWKRTDLEISYGDAPTAIGAGVLVMPVDTENEFVIDTLTGDSIELPTDTRLVLLGSGGILAQVDDEVQVVSRSDLG